MMWPDIRANGGEEDSAEYEPAAGSKVLPLEAAISPFAGPRDVVHAAYTGARPCAALFEIARRCASTGAEITLTGAGLAGPRSRLAELGVVRHVVARFVGENYPVARPNPSFQRALKDGRVTVENWPLWSLIARLVAGAPGMPFIPAASLHHTSMAQELSPRGYARIRDPFEPPSQGGNWAGRPLRGPCDRGRPLHRSAHSRLR